MIGIPLLENYIYTLLLKIYKGGRKNIYTNNPFKEISAINKIDVLSNTIFIHNSFEIGQLDKIN